VDIKTRRIGEKLLRELGPAMREALADPAVTEIMLNSDGRIWTEHQERGMHPVGEMSALAAESLLATIAATLGTVIGAQCPSLEGELALPGNPRVAGSVPPKTLAPQLTIRKPALKIFTLADYVAQGALGALQRQYLREAIAARKNLLIAGGTASGKTTLVNALIDDIATQCPRERVYLLEDTREIQCASPNHERFRTSAAESMEALVKSTLRHRPDRIIVGEVRDGAALALLEAWNTGHEGGIATVHARHGGATGALLRLEYLMSKAQRGDHRALIGEALDVIVTLERLEGRRRVTGIIEVHGFDREAGAYRTHTAFRGPHHDTSTQGKELA
jgi:P-type conjugative transfer ATPase TrbB